MIIDIVSIYADGSGQFEKMLPSVILHLKRRGNEVRYFKSHKSVNNNWESALSEVYYYGEKNGLEHENTNSLIEGYRKCMQNHGKPDAILVPGSPIINYICRTASSMVPGHMPYIYSWLQGVPDEYGYEEALHFADAHFVTSRQVEDLVTRYSLHEQPNFQVGEMFLSSTEVIPAARATDRPNFCVMGSFLTTIGHFNEVCHAFRKISKEIDLTVVVEEGEIEYVCSIAKEIGIHQAIKWKKPSDEIGPITAVLLCGTDEIIRDRAVHLLASGIIPIVPYEVFKAGNAVIVETGYQDLERLIRKIISGERVLPTASDCLAAISQFTAEAVVEKIDRVIQSPIKEHSYLGAIHDKQYMYFEVMNKILETAIHGIELKVKSNEDTYDYLSMYYTHRYISEHGTETVHRPEQTVAYPKVESLDVRYSVATVRFLLIRQGEGTDSQEKILCRMELVNRSGSWKIDKLNHETALSLEYLSQLPAKGEGRKRLALIARNSSGSNTYALNKNIPKDISKVFDVELLLQQETQDFLDKVASADVLIITEANIKHNKRLYNPNQLIIDTWHGFPLKAMGFEDKNEQNKHVLADRWSSINYICSYSPYFTKLMTRCFKLDPERILLTGAPRNDLLLKRPDTYFLKEEFDIDASESRMIFFMPTYRQLAHNDRADTNLNRENLFGMESFDNDQFYDFLEKENLELIVKLHPAEEKLFLNHFEMQTRVHLLTDEMLTRYGMDLYEIMPLADMLITDYSSIYFDYLLLDKPIIFSPVDLQSYQQNRGFILDSYTNWTPGPKVTTQDTLQDALASFIENPSWYGAERKQVRDQVHHFQDSKSSERVWKFIQEKISAYTQPV
ncbi:CDP-glycerol glycerophosphotransferase family protein [Terribacillus sp. AE2B 122]|uniref:CDP-glycerol glycerophosphotransferase family protein n=1 Tax=Terribacillus sp. AE2B 122 TaxID=1331902 RepID=UPI001582CDB9|nr:CDP-glycerol glycerophosphotransferase family protein [Terribacillus sp. AE2B 122]